MMTLWRGARVGLDLNHRDATDLWLVGITQAECLSEGLQALGGRLHFVSWSL